MQSLGLALILGASLAVAAGAQEPAEQKSDAGWRKAETGSKPASEEKTFTVQPGTKIPLSMINSISTKHAAEGDRVYLETVFPILVDGRIVIPPGSYVAGTVTESKRPGKVKGRGELYVRFDSLTLPNGVTRDFRSRIGSLDGRASEDLDRKEGKIVGEGNKSGDATTVAGTTASGAMIGGLAGRSGMGAGIGAAAGAAAGLVGVLLSRGPDAVLSKGTTLEMVLDRPLSFEPSEIEFGGTTNFRRSINDGSGPLPSKKNSTNTGRRIPGVGGWPY